MPPHPRTPKHLLPALAAAIALAASTTRAAITPTGDVSPANPSSWTTSTTAYIGNTSGGTLTVTPTSKLLSSVGYLGYASGATGTVAVNGTASAWANGGSLCLGYLGAGTLSLTNGGTVSSLNSYLGYNTGATGTATVDGTGSKWTNSSLYVGNSATGTLTITKGGTVTSSTAAYLGYNSGSTGTVTVDGAGSKWADSGTLCVGNAGTGTLSLTNRGQVSSSTAYVGSSSGATGTVMVSGTGSAWANTGSLFLGYSGAGTLSLTNGGTVSSLNSYLGYNTGATGTATVDGTGSTLTCLGPYVGYNGTGAVNITNGGKVSSAMSITYLAYNTGATGRVTVDGTGSIWTTNNSFVVGGSGTGLFSVTNGGNVNDASGYAGYNAGSTGTATVDGINSTWTNTNTLCIGYSGTGILNIANGGNVNVTSSNIQYCSYLGQNAGSAGTVTVDGTGSTWTCANVISAAPVLNVGFYGAGTLGITNAGKVVATGTVYLATRAGSSGTATVDGVGSAFTVNGPFYVGFAGGGMLNITNGGMVTTTGTTYVGYYAGGSINFGASGGTLSTPSLFAAFNQLTGSGTINTRGLVSDIDLVFDATHGLSQTLTAINAPQNVTVNLDLSGASGTVGALGAGYKNTGTLAIQGGMKITSAGGYLGYNGGSTATATVSGSGSTWTSSGSFYVGYSGTATLNLTNGGMVFVSATSYLGYGTGSTGTATVDGTGSTWTNSGVLHIGYSGTGTLNVTNAGLVSNSDTHLATLANTTGTVTVDGTGSTLTSQTLYVGDSGAGILNITNGAMVTVAASTYVAYASTATGSINFGTNGGTLTTLCFYGLPTCFTGTGTINMSGYVSDADVVFDATHGLNQTQTWINANQNVTAHLNMSAVTGDLGAGYQGTGTLAIRDGLAVTSAYGILGYKTGSTGTATISGSGSTWTTSNYLYVGNSGTGSLTITNGAKVTSSNIYLAYNAGASGTTTVDGAGSTCTNNGALFVGNSGTATLNITNGGQVNTSSDGYLGSNTATAGTVTIDGAGSTWNNSNLYVGYSGNGTLNIAHGGVVNSSSSSSLGYNPGTTGWVTVDGIGSSWNFTTASGHIYVGNNGAGTLTITNGGQVTNNATGHGCDAIIGACAKGTATVDGIGSSWTIRSDLVVGGDGGTGTMTITNGGKVINGSDGYLGENTGATGTVTVDGTGSSWGIGRSLYLGYYGTGTLNITNGGHVTADRATINALLTLNVGDGSVFVGTNDLTNNGTIRLKAVPGLAAGTYTPITGSFNVFAPGTVQALGGKWYISTHSFIVSAPANGTTGQPVSINLLQTQRVIITDPITSNTVEANFQSTTVTTNLTLSALTLTPTLSTLLQSALPANTNILTGWTLTPTGYTAGTPVFLSLQIGPNQSLPTLALWHYDNNSWSPYAAPDLSYDGTYANFTVTNFSAYAVTAQVPEPAPLALLALGLAPLLLRHPRRHPRATPLRTQNLRTQN